MAGGEACDWCRDISSESREEDSRADVVHGVDPAFGKGALLEPSFFEFFEAFFDVLTKLL